MGGILDDVRKDAMKKFKPTGEEDKKQIIDAAVQMLEIEIVVWAEGFLAMEEYREKDTVDGFLKRIICLSVDGTEPGLVFEIATNEYWVKDPQGTQAMVFCIYLWGAECICFHDDLTTMVKSLRTLLPAEYHEEFDRQADNIVEKQKQIRQKREEELALFDKKWALNKQEADKFLYFHPAITNMELLETVRTLEKEIGELPDLSLQKVLSEMQIEILFECFYVFGDETRQRIRDNYESFDSRLKSYNYIDYVIEVKEHEEEELLGAVLVMSGTMKQLRRQDN